MLLEFHKPDNKESYIVLSICYISTIKGTWLNFNNTDRDLGVS